MKNTVLLLLGCALLCAFIYPIRPPAIVLLRTYVVTNTIPGYIGGVTPTLKTDANGYLVVEPVPAVAIVHPPTIEIVTNYVLGFIDGTNQIEILTAQKP